MRGRLRRIGFLLLLVLVATFLGGCWDNRDPNRRVYVMGLGIDVDPDDPDSLLLSAQVPIPYLARPGGRAGGGGGAPEFTLAEGRGRTLTEALQSIQDRMGRELYFGQTRAILFSEQLSPELFRRAVEGARNDPDLEDTIYLVMTRGRARDVLGTRVTMERLPALFFNNIFEAVRVQTVAQSIRLWEFWRALSTSGWAAMMPVVEQVAKGELELRGVAVFRGYELAGILTGEESQGLHWLLGVTKSRALSLRLDGEMAGVRSLAVSRSMQVRFAGGQPIFRIELTIIGESSLGPDHREPTELQRELSRAAERAIRGQIDAALQKLQGEYRSDVLGLGKILFYRYPDYFARVDWREVFPTVRIEREVKVRLLRKGELY
jgi:spore germination protein KC